MKWCFDLIFIRITSYFYSSSFSFHFILIFTRFHFRVHWIFCFKFDSTASISAVFNQTQQKWFFFFFHHSFIVRLWFGFLIYRWVENWKHEVFVDFWNDSCSVHGFAFHFLLHLIILASSNPCCWPFFFFSLMHCTIFRVTDKWFKSTNVMCFFFRYILLVGRCCIIICALDLIYMSASGKLIFEA